MATFGHIVVVAVDVVALVTVVAAAECFSVFQNVMLFGVTTTYCERCFYFYLHFCSYRWRVYKFC